MGHEFVIVSPKERPRIRLGCQKIGVFLQSLAEYIFLKRKLNTPSLSISREVFHTNPMRQATSSSADATAKFGSYSVSHSECTSRSRKINQKI